MSARLDSDLKKGKLTEFLACEEGFLHLIQIPGMVDRLPKGLKT